MKTLYRLRPSKSIQKDFYVFDVETNGRRAKPDAFIFGAIYGNGFVKVIYSVDEFKKEFLKERYKGKKVFAHNATFDLDTIYSNIYELDNEAIFNGSRFIMATNGNCVFCDSTNIYKTSVSKLGKLLGTEKQKLSDEFLSGENYDKKITKKDIEYCIQDCRIVYEALIRAFEFSGQICITQASLSMAYYRRYHLPFNIEANDNVNTFFNSYYGGRTEAFKIGQTHAYCYDANSMYPFSMVNTDFPNPRNLKWFTGKINKTQFLSRYLYNYEGCAHLEIEHNNHWVGFLPLKKDGKLIFPTGTFSGWWNFNEIRFALEHKSIKIKKVFDVVYSTSMHTPFKSFIDTLYTKRFETLDEFWIFFYKIFMNSLYGKFAQRIQSETRYIENVFSQEAMDLVDKATKARLFVKLQMFSMERNDGYLITKKSKFKQPTYSIPSFASYITSHSRVHLLKFLLEHESYRPVYCDTDSGFFEMELPKKVGLQLENIPQLGDWKKEDKIVTKIRGLKNYDCMKEGEFERHIKGVPFKRTDFNELVCYDEYNFSYKTMVKTKEALRRGIESGVLTERTKAMKKSYDKRIIINDDGWTKPIEL